MIMIKAVMFSFRFESVTRLIGGDKTGNKERWYCVFCGNEYNIWNSTKSLMHLTRSGGHSIAQLRGEILSKDQRQFKVLKEKKQLFRNQRVSKRDLLQT